MSWRSSGGRLFRCAPHVGEMSYSFDPQAVEHAGCPEAALEELEGFAACSALDTARKFRTCNKSSSVNCFAFDFNLARFFSWFFSSLATRFLRGQRLLFRFQLRYSFEERAVLWPSKCD